MNTEPKTLHKNSRTEQVFDDYLQFELTRGTDDRLSLQFECDEDGIFCRIVWLATEGMTRPKCESIVARVKQSVHGMTRAEVEDYMAKLLRKTLDISAQPANS